ncbi:MAG TPA: CopD family protein [Rhodanobacteraceae bacterium]|nr:CopD family protein [Rhodanobacteraceae bacterium]
MAVVPHGANARLTENLRRVSGVALALLTLASFGILLSRTLELNGDAWATLWPDMRIALGVTHFGHVWLWRMPALAIAWMAWAWSVRKNNPRAAWIMLAAFAAIALTRSNTGHPADHGDFMLAVWLDWLHLLAAGTWVGSLFGMSLAVFPVLLRRSREDAAPAARIFQRLSTLCGVALAVLVACGVYNASHQLGSVDALWNTRYGMILDVKLALVLVMILIGAHNRYIKLPRLHAAGNTPSRQDGYRVIRSCARAVLVEGLLGLAVIGATATLVHAMPPADARALSPSSMAAHADSPIVEGTARR